MRRFCVFAILCVLAPAAAFAQANFDPARVAYFSPERVFAGSRYGKAMMARLSAVQKEKEAPIEERTKKLRVDRRVFQQTASTLSDSARAERARELEGFEIETQRLLQDLKAELAAMQREAQAKGHFSICKGLSSSNNATRRAGEKPARTRPAKRSLPPS